MLFTNEMGKIRLFCARPAGDESISSLISRACALHGLRRYELIGSLLLKRDIDPLSIVVSDWDDPPEPILLALADAVGMSLRELQSLAISDGPEWVAPNARIAFCPLCFQSDLASGKSPYFRRSWAQLFVTMCPVHCRPLYCWYRSHLDDGNALPMDWQLPGGAKTRLDGFFFVEAPGGDSPSEMAALGAPRNLRTAAVANSIRNWERVQQELATHFGNPLQAADIRFKQVGRLISSFALNHAPYRTKTLIGTLNFRDNQWILASGGHTEPIGSLDRWETFRRIGTPANRRAAFCLAAATLERDWPVNDFITWPRLLPSGGSEWWHWIIMPMVHPVLDREMESIRQELGIPKEPPRAPEGAPKRLFRGGSTRSVLTRRALERHAQRRSKVVENKPA